MVGVGRDGAGHAGGSGGGMPLHSPFFFENNLSNFYSQIKEGVKKTIEGQLTSRNFAICRTPDSLQCSYTSD